TRLVFVECRLHQRLDPLFHLTALGGDDRLELAAPDNFAHGALGDLTHRFIRVTDVENEVADVLHIIDDAEVDLGDVAIAGDHEALIRIVVDDVGARRLETNLGGALPGDVDDLSALDRRRQTEKNAWAGGAIVVGEARDDGLHAFINGINSSCEPAHEQEASDQRPREATTPCAATAATAARAATEHAVAPLAENFIEIGASGRRCVPRRALLAPRLARTAAPWTLA